MPGRPAIWSRYSPASTSAAIASKTSSSRIQEVCVIATAAAGPERLQGASEGKAQRSFSLTARMMNTTKAINTSSSGSASTMVSDGTCLPAKSPPRSLPALPVHRVCAVHTHALLPSWSAITVHEGA
jgi:hypothetical protein